MNEGMQPTSLPFWVQAIGFVVTVILALFKVFEYVKKPKLYLHLTRDIFFRLNDNGEALFCNAVLLASNGPVLVRNASVDLRRIDKSKQASKAEKSYPLVITQYGEKVHGATVHAEHKFFGSSPLQYLEAAKPHRAVYVCFQREYQEKQAATVTDCLNSIERFRLDHADSTARDGDAIRASFRSLLDAHYHSMAGLIQVESGDYELTLRVEYGCVGRRFLGAGGETKSVIKFSIEEQILERWKADLRRLLTSRGQQILTETTGVLIFPELEPIHVTESV